MGDSIYISPGNRKTGRIPTFSLPAVVTCPGRTALCEKLCYAKRPETYWPVVWKSRVRNLLVTSKKGQLAAEVVRWYRRKKHEPKYFRIHESGDFYSQSYLEDWFKACRILSEVRFCAFTKSFHLDYSKKPDNLVIYWSVMEDTTGVVPSGLRAYTGNCGPKSTYECSQQTGRVKHCDECLHCFEGRSDVHFRVH